MIDQAMRRSAMRICAMIALFVAAISMVTFAAPAAARDNVFTVAKYPVEATGANAITAKREALAEGRRAAFRSLSEAAAASQPICPH